MMHLEWARWFRIEEYEDPKQDSHHVGFYVQSPPSKFALDMKLDLIVLVLFTFKLVTTWLTRLNELEAIPLAQGK